MAAMAMWIKPTYRSDPVANSLLFKVICQPPGLARTVAPRRVGATAQWAKLHSQYLDEVVRAVSARANNFAQLWKSRRARKQDRRSGWHQGRNSASQMHDPREQAK
jgi:hypothetical protein